MLDTGSEISMLRIPVAKNLSLTGVKTKVVISGVNSTKTVDTVVSKIKSKGISCECEYDLANVYIAYPNFRKLNHLYLTH